ncbi:MAG: protein kinase domain-containing protein, partial [Casimicrobium sp.]
MNFSATSSADDAFDASFWRAANNALDRALDLPDADRRAFVTSLGDTDPELATEVTRLLTRIEQIGVNAPNNALGALTPALGQPASHSHQSRKADDAVDFDPLSQRALHAEKHTRKSARHRGELCGAWRLDNMIGAGGMGEVWLAERADGLYRAKAAVKFLRTDSNAAAFEARFSQERMLLARLNHAGIARLLDAGRKFGTPFLVLEYVEGKQLLDYLNESAATVAERLRVLRQIVEAVAYAHSQLVVHRDLKPSNVLVTTDGQVKLLDFGVAGLLQDQQNDEITESALTRTTGRGLTLEYASPEQIVGEATGVASDVYSLGALGFHMLAGRRAHLSDKPGRAALEYLILHPDAPRLSQTARETSGARAKDSIAPPRDAHRIDGDLDAIIACALRRDPQPRYRSADALLADLWRLDARRPVSVRSGERSYRVYRWLRRHWLPALLGTTLLGSLVAGLGVSVWQTVRARTEAARATKAADYLVDLLRSTDPEINGGQWPTALSLLERAKQDVERRFASDPQTEARLSTMLASTFRSLSRDTEALPVAKRAVELSRQQFGEASLETALATSTLAEIQYWLEDERDALYLFDQAIPILQKNLAANDVRLQRAVLNRANTLARLFRFEESEAAFQAHLSSLGAGDTARWSRAEAEGDYARSLTSQGRWSDAHDILLRNEAIYNIPPKGQEKLALLNRQSLASAQVVLGRYDGAEVRMLALRDAWTALAGPKSMQVFELHNELGYLYYRLGEGKKSEEIYRELRRLQDELPDFEPLRKWTTEIDLLEIQLLFGRAPLSQIDVASNSLAARIADTPKAKSERGVWLYTRLALIVDACGDAARARSLLAQAREIARELKLAEGPWLRRIVRAEAGIDRRTGAADSLAKLQSSRAATVAAQKGGFSQRVIGAHLEYALAVAARNPDAARAALAEARATLPPTIPKNHYARALVDFVAVVIEPNAD